MQNSLKPTQVQNVNIPLVARLKSHMARKGLNPKTLAEKAKVGRSFVYDIINGKSTNPTSAKLTAVAEQLDVSVSYLLSGVQQVSAMRRNDVNDVVEIPYIKVENSASGRIIAANVFAKKPYLFSKEWVKNRLLAEPEDLRALMLKGDSMEPTLYEGDVVLLNTKITTPSPPGMFVLFDDVDLIVKRLEIVGKDMVCLISDNVQYTTFQQNLANINIVGKVVWLAREF